MEGSTPPGNEHPISAEYNEWGYHPVYDISERFGALDVSYFPTGVILPDGTENCEIIITTADGTEIDTLLPVAENPEINPIDELYAQAEEEISDGDYSQAKAIYQNIIENYSALRTSFYAFSRLLMIERVTDSDTSVFSALRGFYLSYLNTVSDTLMQRMISNLANIALVYSGAYTDAMWRFEQIIQENPGSEEAVFAEIDYFTVEMLRESGWLGKGKGKRTTTRSFNSQLMNTLTGKLNGKYTINKVSDIPDEYRLFQNYPNPFNPVTRITYHLPEDGIVMLKVYDILGREVKTLVKEYKERGRYTVDFDGRNLSSGVYICRIKAGEYSSTIKMTLIK